MDNYEATNGIEQDERNFELDRDRQDDIQENTDSMEEKLEALDVN